MFDRRLSTLALAVALIASPPGPAHAGGLLDPFVALPWAPIGSQDFAGFGMSVAPAGDINGDGYGDVVVGSPGAGTTVPFEGRAFVYLGSPQGSSPTPDWSYASGQALAGAGSRVASAGDVNGDGFADLLVAVRGWDTPADSNAGKVAVFHGGPNGLPLTPSFELFSPQPADDANFGMTIATAGDVNGDGYADILVASRFLDGGFDRGAVFVFHGSPTGLGANFSQRWYGTMGQNSQFGTSLSSAGDINGDGRADVIVGAPAEDAGFFLRAGIAYLYLGTPISASDVSTQAIVGNKGGVECGRAVSLAGDVNGDGFGDILVGFPGNNNGAGKAELHFGGAQGLTSSEVVLNPEILPGDGFGHILATLGDLDGDGFADFGVAAFHVPGNRGRIGVYRGGRTARTYVGDLLSRGTDGYFGASFGTTGDTDGDGRAEILVGTEDMSAEAGHFEGRAFQFKAPRLLPRLASGGWPRAGAQLGTRYGTALAILPHFNGADLGRLVIGDPNFDGFGRISTHIGTMAAGVNFTETSSIVASSNAQAFGTRIVEAGDMNGDGFSDFAVSSPTLSVGQTIQNGRVDFHPGSSAATPPLPIPVVLGVSTFDRVGSALAGRGDVNGDGYHDLLVGAGGWDEPGRVDCGKAYLFFGSPSGPAAGPWVRVGALAEQGLGASVALADLDADGYTDVILGSSSPTFGATVDGKVEVHYGGPAGPATEPGLVLTSLEPHVSYGRTVASIGDVNADGVADLGVGAPTEGGAGVVRVYAGTLGRSQTRAPIVMLRGTQAGGRFGEAITGGGDVDGDGRGDFAIGEPGRDAGHTDEGRVYLFFGAPLMPEIPATFIFEPDLLAAEFGAALAPLRDINGDGFADLIVGAPGAGRVYPFLGGGGPGKFIELQPEQAGVQKFHPARTTLPDKVRAQFFLQPPGSGRARLKYEVELVTQDESFTGVPTTTSALSHDSGLIGGVLGVEAVLPQAMPGRAFKLRGRWTTPSPFFPRSRWITPEAHTSGDHDAWLTGTVVGVPPADRPGESLRILGVSPNPAGRATGSSRIAFALPHAGQATIDVIDLRGARVRRVLDEARAAGPSVASWDGRDEAGRAVAAGVYFVVVRVNGASDRAKVVRLP